MNAARLGKMKPDAYLINVARGPLIDEPALLDALQKHRIGGAALDVFNEEPLPATSPFWSLDNLLITPHTAAVTERLWERHYRLIVDNMKRFLAGEPLMNQVDKKRGY
jgi:phosphoglycerate dehydrogenase-like enzyme